MIDSHMHLGLLYFGEEPLTPEYLLAFMDEGGIDRAVLLPIESPECTSYYVPTSDVLEACRQYPERFIPFCNVDPRRMRVADQLREFRREGCLGYGEAMSGLVVDDPLLQVVYRTCGELQMPIVFDIDKRMNLDDSGLPRFEAMLKAFPDTVFIGHGPMFWAEISGGFERRGSVAYPKGPVRPGGVVPRLLETYANLYADISAGSGFNALNRQPDYGDRFMDDFQDKLLFGTDICHHGQKVPHMNFMRSALAAGRISQAVFDKIASANLEALLDL